LHGKNDFAEISKNLLELIKTFAALIIILPT